MNSKIVLAFFAGAVLASGIVYMAVRNEPVAKPARLASAPVKPIYAPTGVTRVLTRGSPLPARTIRSTTTAIRGF